MSLQSDAVSYSNEEINCLRVFDLLNPEDVKKFYFLVMDSLPKLTQCPQTANELFSLLKLQPAEAVKLLQKLLFYTKKYKLLRLLDTCSHNMKKNVKISDKIDLGRLLLFNLCEDLKDSNIEILKNILEKTEIPHDPNWNNVAAEEFFSIWLRDINEKKIESLLNALPQVNNKNINALKEEFRNYFKKPFSIRTPSIGNPCGLAIIFNFKNFNTETVTCDFKKRLLREKFLETRTGTEMDEKVLIDLWHKYGFDVLVFRNLTSTVMMDVIEKCKKFHFNNYDVFISCVLTHGGRNDVIYASDNIPLDIYGDLAYNLCIDALEEKPKLFFIQACQENLDINDNLPDEDRNNIVSDSPNTKPVILNRYLMLIISDISLKSALSQNNRGSWLVSELNDVFEAGDDLTDDLQKLVNRLKDNLTKHRGGTFGAMPERLTVMHPLYLKQLENPSPVCQLNSVDEKMCPSLFQLIKNFPVQPHIYLV